MSGLYDESEAQGSSETLYPLEVNESKKAPADASETGKIAISYRNRIFNEEMFRTVKLANNSVGFCAADVCKILGYKNTSDTIEKHCKNEITKYNFPTDGGKQELAVISEPDLYRLVIKSRKPEAQAFEKWVMEEVLPEVRRDGKYKVGRKINYTPEANPEALPAESEQAVQVELFPRIFTGTFPNEFTKRLNSAKRVLAASGKTFPTNKDYLMFVADEGLKAIAELEGRV